MFIFYHNRENEVRPIILHPDSVTPKHFHIFIVRPQFLEKIVIAANFLQGCSPLLSLFAYLPQWRKIIANRSSRDISLTSWLVWLLSSAIAIFYAVIQYQVTGKGTALIFSSVLVLVFVFITVCLIALYRKDDRSRA
jgi:uncharacterized protein with PQ loop repeat